MIDFANSTQLFIILVASITQSNLDSRTRSKFQRNILLMPPTVSERLLFIKQYIPAHLHHHSEQISHMTVGYLCGDLMRLLSECKSIKTDDLQSVSRVIRKLNIRPSLKSDHSSTDHWREIGGLEQVKLKLRQAAEWPSLYPHSFERLGLTPPRGILLYGPPGCAKTSLVRALAKSTKSTFLYCNVAQIYSPYLGESERELRDLFQKARLLNPSILFLDELDAIVGKRDMTVGGLNQASSSGGVESRILSTLLNEMDGIESTKDLLVVAATNRPDCIDHALLRPGRLDHILYVPPPDLDSKRDILKIHCNGIPLCEHDNESGDMLERIACDENLTGDMTGAEIESMCREACMCAMREWERSGDLNIQVDVNMKHFLEARRRIVPAIRRDPSILNRYKEFEESFYKK
ncbi:SPATA5 [Acrasis kona]|uniref:SPATA5 n=1 Tax=Acrasis kona TaxID=1008807 RepID=A0AAW2YS53_9EUKA